MEITGNIFEILGTDLADWGCEKIDYPLVGHSHHALSVDLNDPENGK